MSEILNDSPNSVQPQNPAAPINNSVPSLDSISQKIAAMRNMRNDTANTNETETGSSVTARKEESVVPESIKNDTSSDEPEVVQPENEIDESQVETDAPEQVSNENSTEDDIIDFLQFADENPNAKFRFKRNGKDMVIDAKQAQAILGQGGAIHEEARQLKIQKAEFDEYLKEKQAATEGLILAMEFTIVPEIQKAMDNIREVQNYQSIFQQQLNTVTDPGERARIQAGIEQNERYIQQESNVIRELKPKVDQFYEIRKQQVSSVIENNRKGFKDKELKNQHVFTELRDKLSKGWDNANNQLVPGVNNIDLVSSDEYILSLLRDGMKYREKPSAKSAGNSIAALTQKRTGVSNVKSGNGQDVEQIREQAKKTGDKKAWDQLLAMRLSQRKR